MDLVPTPLWTTPSAFPSLSLDETHIWRFGLVPAQSEIDVLEAFLDEPERKRADSFRGRGLRSKFVAGRGNLRRLLGGYLRINPSEVRFEYGAHGKPGLAGGAGGITFNLAHSGEVALLAVSMKSAVGVDIESLRPLENAEKIIQRFFSNQEQAEFLGLPESERFVAFYLGWTRKEAFLKARGTGLSTRLDSFDVSLSPNRPAAILRVDDDHDPGKHWRIVDIDPGEGYAGALVVATDGRAETSEKHTVRLFDVGSEGA